MDNIKENLKNNFLKRFSAENGSLDGVTVKTENNAVGAENEQNTHGENTDVRNTSVEPEHDSRGEADAHIKKSSMADNRAVWSFLDVDDEVQFDIEGVRNTAREMYVGQRLQSWEKEAQELMEKYPDFDIGGQVKNPLFLAMLRCGITVEGAYKALNYDEVLKWEVGKAVDLFIADLRVRGSRPSENGLISGGGVNMGLGARSFSRKERAEIARRVENGEKIIL